MRALYDPVGVATNGERWATTRSVDTDPGAPLLPRPATEAELMFLRRLRWAPLTLALALGVLAAHALLSFGAFAPLLSTQEVPLSETAFVGLLLSMFLLYGGPAVFLFRRLYHRRLKPALGRPPLRPGRVGTDAPLQQVTGAYSEVQGSHDRTYRLVHTGAASADPYRVFEDTAIAMPPHWRRYVLNGVYTAALGRTRGGTRRRKGVSGLLFGRGQQFYAVALTQAFTLARLSSDVGVGLPGRVLHGADDPSRMALSVEREVGWGLRDILWYRPLRLTSVLVVVGGAVFLAALVGTGLSSALLGGLPSASALALVRSATTSTAGAILLWSAAALALPSMTSWALHRRAVEQIEAGYSAGGLVPWSAKLRREWSEAPLPEAAERR